MNRQILATIALVLTLDTAGAVRVLEQVERPVELSLGDLTLPTADGGNLTFKECPRCGISSHRVTSETVYMVNGQTLPFAEFAKAVELIRDKRDGDAKTFAAVFLDIESGRVTRVEIRE
jgi:hypothetical protein